MKTLSVVPRLILDTKAIVPFPAAQVMIYQPSLKEIGMIGGDQTLLMGAEALSRNYSNFKDKVDSVDISDFEIFMKVIGEKSDKNRQIAQAVEQVLFLIFPNYKVGFTPRSIILQEDNENKTIHMIDANNFKDFGLVIRDIFCLAELSGTSGDDYNPSGDRARALVEKFRKKKELLAELRREQGKDDNVSIFGRYMDILAVGLKKDKNVLANYSVYQITEEFKRFQLKETFDYTIQAKLAGAKNVKDAKDWMGDIQFGVDNDDD